jgi:hypothetical protein
MIKMMTNKIAIATTATTAPMTAVADDPELLDSWVVAIEDIVVAVVVAVVVLSLLL